MTRLDWYEQGYAQAALELGELSPCRFQYFITYKVYQRYRAKNSQTKAVELAAEELRRSDAHVIRAIRVFSDKTALSKS